MKNRATTGAAVLFVNSTFWLFLCVTSIL